MVGHESSVYIRRNNHQGINSIGFLVLRLAHEQRVAPHEATAASDIYALGISWYKMMTGDTPDPFVVGAKAFADPSRDLQTNSLIRQMLEFEQSKRPAAADILDKLRPT